MPMHVLNLNLSPAAAIRISSASLQPVSMAILVLRFKLPYLTSSKT